KLLIAYCLLLFLVLRPRPRSSLFPYTTLFRSGGGEADGDGLPDLVVVRAGLLGGGRAGVTVAGAGVLHLLGRVAGAAGQEQGGRDTCGDGEPATRGRACGHEVPP